MPALCFPIANFSDSVVESKKQSVVAADQKQGCTFLFLFELTQPPIKSEYGEIGVITFRAKLDKTAICEKIQPVTLPVRQHPIRGAVVPGDEEKWAGRAGKDVAFI